MLQGRVSKPLAGLVGLGQEAIQHSKDKKAAASNEEGNPPPEYSENDDLDEDDWIADDVQDHLSHDDSPSKEQKTKDTIEWFLSRHASPEHSIATKEQLPAPVIIPQKRPNAKSRGFVRAYAPALNDCGVDQDAFLDFLDGFHKQINKHGYFNATNIAIALSVMTYTISIAPSAIVHFSALAVHISIETGRRLYISKKTNSYLDEINAHFFQPRGLYAMVMVYKPGSKEESEVLDFETTSAAAVDTRTSDNKSSRQDYRAGSGKTLNQQLPECCPLVFPELDKASTEQTENAFKRSLAFAQDYYDRRGQAEFANKDPNSKLNIQEQEFAGTHGDPNAYENSSVLGVVTGGKFDPRQQRLDRKTKLRERLGRGGRSGSAGRGSVLGAVGTVKRSLGDNVLYLMVVNMPSDEELQAAKEAEENMKRDQPNWFEKIMSQV